MKANRGARVTLAVAVVALGGAGAIGAALAAPSISPPKRPPAGPPPAWLETPRGSFWLGYSSYCWHGRGSAVCADYVGPSCNDRAHVPRLVLHRGEPLRLHLAFMPSEVGVLYHGRRGHLVRARQTLPPRRVIGFVLRKVGVFSVFAKAARGGDASYAACAVSG